MKNILKNKITRTKPAKKKYRKSKPRKSPRKSKPRKSLKKKYNRKSKPKRSSSKRKYKKRKTASLKSVNNVAQIKADRIMINDWMKKCPAFAEAITILGLANFEYKNLSFYDKYNNTILYQTKIKMKNKAIKAYGELINSIEKFNNYKSNNLNTYISNYINVLKKRLKYMICVKIYSIVGDSRFVEKSLGNINEIVEQIINQIKSEVVTAGLRTKFKLGSKTDIEYSHGLYLAEQISTYVSQNSGNMGDFLTTLLSVASQMAN
jgi:hypothetical protein